ncbi:MAG: DMT family transporter [Longicatena sp.]
MELILAMLSGIICTIMLAWNGQLSTAIGIYLSTFVIHILGLLTIWLYCKWKHLRIPFHNHLPWFFYMGGVIGVLTVFFNVYTIEAIGASLVSALGLLGQLCASLVLEQKGWLGSVQSDITKSKLVSLGIIVIGIGVMLL